MSYQSPDYEVFLSYCRSNRQWGEALSDRLGEERIRVRPPANHATPLDTWNEWLKARQSEECKLVFVCSQEYFEDPRVAALIDDYFRANREALMTERAVIPVFLDQNGFPKSAKELCPLDFSNPKDFELRLCQLLEAIGQATVTLPKTGTSKSRGIMALNSLFKWMGVEKDGGFADGVAQLYKLLGFEIKRNEMSHGGEIDLLIERRFGGLLMRTMVECYEKTPSKTELQALIDRWQKICLAGPRIDCLIVTAESLEPQIARELDSAKINSITYPALLREIIPLEGYVKTILEKLRKKRAECWKGQDWFIRPQVKTRIGGQLRPALLHIAQWLQGRHAPLLPLLGDVGTGKSTLAEFLAHEMAEAYLRDPLRHPVPVLVELQGVRKETSLESIIITHFKEHLSSEQMNEFSYTRFDFLVRHGQIVLLFDAFDEMAERLRPEVIKSNLKELVRPAFNNGKVLITCRTHYFKNSSEQEELIGKGALYLQEFTNEQVREYLEKVRPETATEDWAKIQDIYNLKDLVRRPLLLDMVVKSMPDLKRVDAATLYAKYADIWFEREQGKGRLLGKPVKLELMKELAWKIWEEERQAIYFKDLLLLVPIFRERYSHRSPESDDDIAEELRTASFLTRNEEGYYGFADRSFGEYFLACKIHSVLLQPNGEAELRELLRIRLLNQKVIFFLNLLLRESRSFELLHPILKGEYEPRVSENALQILYWCWRIQSGMEAEVTDPPRLRKYLSIHLPRGIRMGNCRLSPPVNKPGERMQLEAADLRGADFSGADLKGVNFNHAILDGARFRGAVLAGASFEDVSAVGTDFREAELSQVRIVRSNLQSADFTGALYRDIVFEENQTDKARGLNLTGGLLRTDLIPVVQQSLSSGTHTMTIAPNGEWYASGSRDGLISLYRIRDDRLLAEFDGHRKRVHSLHFSPAGSLLASGCMDGIVRLWSISDVQVLQEIPAHNKSVRTIQFSPDGKQLASGGDDRIVRKWAVEDGKSLHQYSGFEGHNAGINALHFSEDLRMLASASSDGTVRIWDLMRNTLLHSLHGDVDTPSQHQKMYKVTAVQFSPDGKIVAMTGPQNEILVWRIEDVVQFKVLRGHTGEINSLRFTPNGKHLMSGGKDLSLLVWSVQNGELLCRQDRHSDLIDTIWIAPQGKRVISGCTDRVLRHWIFDGARLSPDKSGLDEEADPDAESSMRLERLSRGGAIRSIGLSANGKFLAGGGDERRLYVWSARKSMLLHSSLPHRGAITALDFHPKGISVATASEDGLVRLWSTQDGSLIGELEGHRGRVLSIHFSQKTPLFASAGEDHTIRLWLAANGEYVNSIHGPKDWLHAVRFSPGGEYLAAGCEDRLIWVWMARDGKQPQLYKRIDGHAAGVTAIQFSPNGGWLASGAKNAMVRLCRPNGESSRMLEGHTERITSLAFTPDEKILASGSSDGTVRLWDVHAGKHLYTFNGHKGEVNAIAISGNSKCLIAAGASGRLQFWDLRSFSCRLHRYGLGPNLWLDILPDGRFYGSMAARRYLCFTEKGALHSHPADTFLNEYFDAGPVEESLEELMGPELQEN